MKSLRQDMTGIILAGGKSSRMGTNKALLKIDEKPLIQRMIELIDPIFTEVIISSNESALYEEFGKKIIKDIYPGRGPLSGIHSIMSFIKNEKCFLISCDMPFVSRLLIDYLINFESEKEIILPRADGRIQQMCGIYSKKLLTKVDQLLTESMQKDLQLKGSIYELLDQVKTEIVDVSELNFYHKDLLFNINTPEDFKYAKQIFEGEQK